MRNVCGFLTVLLLLALPLMARQKKQQALIEPNYILALGTANQFLAAWQHRDQDTGFALISSRLKSKQPQDELRMYISGLSSPHHAAYEVSNGQKLTAGRYAFDVRLYEALTASKEIQPRPKATRIVLQKTAEGEWRVDSLP